MGTREKQAVKKEKTAFAVENDAFICRYELIAKKQITVKKLMKDLKLSQEEFEALETKYLRLFYGKQ
jgi:hypothetical protein